jgi:excinuclease UvrABC nuclease subunit
MKLTVSPSPSIVREDKREADDIPGIGKKRKTALLTKYKSIKKIKKAPPEELAKIIGTKAARALLDKTEEVFHGRRNRD